MASFEYGAWLAANDLQPIEKAMTKAFSPAFLAHQGKPGGKKTSGKGLPAAFLAHQKKAGGKKKPSKGLPPAFLAHQGKVAKLSPAQQRQRKMAAQARHRGRGMRALATAGGYVAGAAVGGAATGGSSAGTIGTGVAGAVAANRIARRYQGVPTRGESLAGYRAGKKKQVQQDTKQLQGHIQRAGSVKGGVAAMNAKRKVHKGSTNSTSDGGTWNQPGDFAPTQFKRPKPTGKALKRTKLHQGQNLAMPVAKKKLSAAERKAMPASQFADPKNRRFPMNDANHARMAVAMAGRGGASPKVQASIKAKAARKGVSVSKAFGPTRAKPPAHPMLRRALKIGVGAAVGAAAVNSVKATRRVNADRAPGAPRQFAVSSPTGRSNVVAGAQRNRNGFKAGAVGSSPRHVVGATVSGVRQNTGGMKFHAVSSSAGGRTRSSSATVRPPKMPTFGPGPSTKRQARSNLHAGFPKR